MTTAMTTDSSIVSNDNNSNNISDNKEYNCNSCNQ